jgi:copper chaperone CopZ
MATTLSVDGMSCEHCEQTVAEALEGVAGVTGVSVDLDGGRATVEGDAAVADLVAAVADAGYEASA